LGLVTSIIGIKMALGTSNVIIILGSILVGGIIGETLDLDGIVNQLGVSLEKLVTGKNKGAVNSSFAKGFVAATLLFCVGPMTVMGSIQDGLTGDYSTLAVKAALDGFAALAFASSFGIGVGFSALSILTVQGSISLGAGYFQGLLTDFMISELTATGGVMIFAIGLGLLDIKKIRVANYLPSIIIAPLICHFISLVA
jgi:uncharacterized membrane protein YqgA involved in biofilm formation